MYHRLSVVCPPLGQVDLPWLLAPVQLLRAVPLWLKDLGDDEGEDMQCRLRLDFLYVHLSFSLQFLMEWPGLPNI